MPRRHLLMLMPPLIRLPRCATAPWQPPPAPLQCLSVKLRVACPTCTCLYQSLHINLCSIASGRIDGLFPDSPPPLNLEAGIWSTCSSFFCCKDSTQWFASGQLLTIQSIICCRPTACSGSAQLCYVFLPHIDCLCPSTGSGTSCTEESSGSTGDGKSCQGGDSKPTEPAAAVTGQGHYSARRNGSAAGGGGIPAAATTG